MKHTAAQLYQKLEGARQPYLDRARENARLTIPSLVPPDSATGNTRFYKPFQSVGARGVNHLANKLVTALLPVNSPFFRLQIDDFTLEKMTQRPGMRGDVEKALNRVERSVVTEIEQTLIRVKSTEAVKQLVVAGNALLYIKPEGGARVYRLDCYVVRRDPSGNLLDIITKEAVAPDTLPKEIADHVMREDRDPNARSHERTVELYTHVTRKGDKWVVYQEVKGIKIPGTQGHYPLDKTPWLPLRWTVVDGEDYGRPYIDDLIGDLRSLEALSKAIVEGSAASAKVLWLVNPNGTTNPKVLTDAPSGAVRSGNAGDVTALQLNKFADFRVALETIRGIEMRLERAFMLKTSVQRPGERVTAEEIREIAGELDDGLGGLYSNLSQEFQLPLVTRIMFQMERQRRLPSLPKEMIKPTITTGLDALGRGHDLAKLDALIAGIAQTFGPEALSQRVNVGEYVKRRGTALGIDMDGLILSDEEVQQAQQQQMMQMMLEKLGPKGMDIVRDQMDPSKQNEPTV